MPRVVVLAAAAAVLGVILVRRARLARDEQDLWIEAGSAPDLR